MAEAVAYIRRSHNDAGGHVSREDQLATVAALAEEYGESITETFIDWGRSGGDSDSEDALKHRPRFRAMLRRIEAGDVSAVFALKIDRLGRSSHALGKLWVACKDNGTRVITTEADFTDDEDPATFLMRHTFEGFAVYYLKDQKRKSAKTKAYTDARGDDYGREPFGYTKMTPKRDGTDRVVVEKTDPAAIQGVLDAYVQAGSFLGAARALNAAGVPTARPEQGSAVQWHASSVERVVRREAPELVPSTVRRGKRNGRPRLFAGLLRCPCGTTLTPGGIERKPTYYCWRAKTDADHSANKGSISENVLRPWIKAEAARVRDPEVIMVDADEMSDTNDKRARLEANRDLFTEDEYAAKLAALDEQDTAGAKRARIAQHVPPDIDWARWDAESINKTLRTEFEYIELGPDLMPVRAVRLD